MNTNKNEALRARMADALIAAGLAYRSQFDGHLCAGRLGDSEIDSDDLDRMASSLSAPASGTAGEAVGEREPAEGEIYGVRFGLGAVCISVGRYQGEPAVILREPEVPGVAGCVVLDDAARGAVRAVLVFPTEAQANAVADALTTPPSASTPSTAGEAVAWARPIIADERGPEGYEPGDLVDIEFHCRRERPNGAGWLPLLFPSAPPSASSSAAAGAVDDLPECTWPNCRCLERLQLCPRKVAMMQRDRLTTQSEDRADG